jgi:predicted nucleotidyltransferase
VTPFGPREIEALRALSSAWPGAETVVVGASAIRCHMPMSWRTSEDLDLSVAASVADAIAAIARLPGWTPDPRQEQRWHSPAGIAVDIVPASPEALARGHLDWPRTGFRMSLLGMRLAFERGVGIRVAPDLAVKVIPLHVVAVLKIVAYLDRPESREKDLTDLAHVMHGYVGADSDRRFSSEVPDDLIEFDDIAPYLLGVDVQAVVNAAEHSRVSDFVAKILDDSQLRAHSFWHAWRSAARSRGAIPTRCFSGSWPSSADRVYSVARSIEKVPVRNPTQSLRNAMEILDAHGIRGRQKRAPFPKVLETAPVV